jgi:N2-citryl-N6-acetyl-N6-hydroxylysine synthase
MEGVKHSATAFFNSFLMESKNFVLSSYENYNAFSIPVEGAELIVPVTHISKLGRHEYEGRFFLKYKDSFEIPFMTAAKKLVDSLMPADQEFYNRVIESKENIVSILESKKFHLHKVYETPQFLLTEKALFAGHSLHPAPKSRQGFTRIDSKLYAPEESSGFPLRWFFIAEELVMTNHSANFSDHEWLTRMFTDEFPDTKIPAGYLVFPMHPWQASRILDKSEIKDYISSGRLREVAGIGSDWHPTSSLRTIFREDAPYMLKFSLDVKLTNSVRHMLSKELVRGLQVHDVLSSPKGQEFLSKNPSFSVMFEPVYLAIKDKNDEPMKETFVMGRENTISQENHYLLAFMTQNHPTFGKNFIQREIEKLGEKKSMEWLGAFLEKVIRPFICAEAEYGILLGGHQQNLLIKMENHLPAGAVFRDCHGTGYLSKGQRYFGSFLDEENGNILDEKNGTYLFSYYLIINSLFNVIGAIASGEFEKEERLISFVRETFFSWLQSDLKDSACLKYLLNEETLMHKGNFLCTLKNINENTTGNPLSIYVDIKNPFFVKESV